MTAYQRLPLKGTPARILLGFAHALYAMACFLSFIWPSASDIDVPEMGQPGWFDRSKERMDGQFDKAITASIGLVVGVGGGFFTVVVTHLVSMADEKVETVSDRASFSHRKSVVAILTAGQGLQLICLIVFIGSFASMRLYLALFTDFLLCLAVSYNMTHNILKLYGPDRRDEMMLYEVGLEQEAGDQEPSYAPFKDDNDEIV